MKIGFVSTWFERGAAYVSKQYADLLKAANHDVYIYARGEHYAIGDPKWDTENVTWGKKLYDTNIDIKHFSSWIKTNELDVLFFNEQREMSVVLKTKSLFPNMRIGTYIDYYTQNTVNDFKWYDFLICNTKRHYSVFDWHPQCYYLPWGTDISLYTVEDKWEKFNELRFFHSVGMSDRKGTDVLVSTFINNKLYEKSKLIIHTQLPIKKLTGFEKEALEQFNIEVIEKTVSAPGLYHMGDVYVYPTTLDGLGLTLYEALSMSMPVIATDCAPMNEVINSKNGQLVDVKKFMCRWDAYYWPLSFVDEDSLLRAMNFYIDNYSNIDTYRLQARKCAEGKYDWSSRKYELDDIFTSSKVIPQDKSSINLAITSIKKKRKKNAGKAIIDLLPIRLQAIVMKRMGR